MEAFFFFRSRVFNFIVDLDLKVSFFECFTKGVLFVASVFVSCFLLLNVVVAEADGGFQVVFCVFFFVLLAKGKC